MAAQRSNRVIAVADVGRSRVDVLAARVGEEGIELIGFGRDDSLASAGRNGVSTEMVSQSLTSALEDLEISTNLRIRSLDMSASIDTGKSVLASGPTRLPAGIVRKDDMDAAIAAAEAIVRSRLNNRSHGAATPLNLNAWVREWSVDGRRGILDPLGMSGTLLEAHVTMVPIAQNYQRAYAECLKDTAIEVGSLVPHGLAASEGVLTDADKQRGVVVVDIGAATTDVVVWADGQPVHIMRLKLGSDAITEQLGIALTVRRADAELLKCKLGCGAAARRAERDTIYVPSYNGQHPQAVNADLYYTVVDPPLAELFAHVRAEVENCGYVDRIRGGVVLTGGGAMLRGIEGVAQGILNRVVRVGTPVGIRGVVEVVDSPRYAVPVGMLKLAVNPVWTRAVEQTAAEKSQAGFYDRVWAIFQRMF